MDKGSEKVSFLASIRLRCIVLVLGCVLITAGVCFIVTVPKFSNEVSSEAKSTMLQSCDAYEKLIEQKTAASGGMIEASQFQEILENVKLKGLSSSYFYLVSSDGTVLYHPEKKKIGKQVDNTTIAKVVEEIGKGNVPESKVFSYTERGTSSFVGYSVNENNHMILVVSVDKSDVYITVQKLIVKSIVFELLCCILLVIVGIIVANSITKPINILCKILKKASKLDFTDDKSRQKLSKRRDEFGLIIHQYSKMQDNLNDMLKRIGITSVNLKESAEDIENVVSTVNSHSQDNSATSQQLAAGMEETAAAVEMINDNVKTIQTNTYEINKKSEIGSGLADEIKNRTDELEDKTKRAIRDADLIFDSVKAKSTLAISKSKAVEKINVLSNTIMEIADETTLLSVNASIEAARAGEMGKGFGVVAHEINNLANQSVETVSNISEIVTEVQLAVNNMTECLETALTFFEENVRRDYNYFKTTSVQYNKDAAQLQTSMNTIHFEIEELSKVTEDISAAVSGIAVTVNQAATGVSDIAGKTSDVVVLVSETGKKIVLNRKYSEELHNIMDNFSI